MKCIYCVLLLLCPYVSRAQQPLNIGDQLPDAVLQSLQTSNGKSLAGLQQNNKWLLLDFMASTCVSCIKLLPAYHALQQQYAADMQIVLVTPQPAAKLQGFVQKYAAYNFPLVVGDTLLHQYFPHQTISHLVWINPAGIVKAITSGYYLGDQSFAQAKSGAPLYWPVKQDGKPYDYKKALLTYNPTNLQEAFTEAPLYYNAVRAALPDVASHTTMLADSNGQVQRYSFINQSLPQMMAKMLGRPTMPPAYFVMNTASCNRFFYQLDTLLKDDWEQAHHYCLEMQLPLQTGRDAAIQQFNHTLQQYFSINARLDTVQRMVWQISGQPKPSIKPAPGYTMQSLGSIITTLNKTAGVIPIITARATSIREKIPMPLPGSMPVADLLKLLESYGYWVMQTSLPLESIIITDY